MKLLSIDEVADRLGLSVMSVRRMVARGDFIKPIQVSPNRIRFDEDEMAAWAANRPRGILPHPPQLAINNKAGATS